MLEEPHHPFVVDRVEERADVGVEHPVHPFLMDADPESVQRLMLASPFTEPVGKAEEVRLIDGVQHRRHGVLDDLVLQGGDAERALPPVRFRDVGTPLLVIAPCHPVDAGRRGSLQLPEALRQQFGRHMVHQRREPCLPVPPCQFTYSVQPRRRAGPALRPGRGRMFAIALGCPPSLPTLRERRGGPADLVRVVPRYYAGIRLLVASDAGLG